ncbi:uncharacterized protein LOC135094274 isoform X2 [Scylla paramamosain]|uniref:uncharacterized protein LOC135094274 isoform X2 n=1 Tax=Scylla paramamosain TaxID=85552 RepID=UPI003083E63A
MVLFFIVTPCHAQQHTGRSDTNVETRDRKAGTPPPPKPPSPPPPGQWKKGNRQAALMGVAFITVFTGRTVGAVSSHWNCCLRHKCRETRHKSRKTTTTTTTFIMTLEKRVETSDTNV